MYIVFVTIYENTLVLSELLSLLIGFLVYSL